MGRAGVIGMAGHVDHGKTALVAALTGIGGDRLPEERARGITIDIGFARLPLGEEEAPAVIDVPGHEDYVHNMITGAAGVDLGVVVVAADDGVMPQTREHVRILHLLHVRGGVLVLTKCDLVDDTTATLAEEELRELVQGTVFETSSIIRTSSTTGHGLSELRAELTRLWGSLPTRTSVGPFRLAVDRAFTVAGHGSVVTGTATAGTVRIGDEFEWHRLDGRREIVRVRGLTVHNRPVPEAVAGQRVGVNLAGVPLADLSRGDELATPGSLEPSRLLSLLLHVSPDAPRPVRHRLPVRVHIGTRQVEARVVLPGAGELAPGESGLAQLHLRSPVLAVWGQPVIVRSSSAEATLGGGPVFEPAATPWGRRFAAADPWLRKLAGPDPAARLHAVAWRLNLAGLRPADAPRLAGTPFDAAGLEELSPKSGRWCHPKRLAERQARLLAALQATHDESPLLSFVPRAAFLARSAGGDSPAVVDALVERLHRSGVVVGDANRLALASFRPKLSANQRTLKERMKAALADAGIQPPEVNSFGKTKPEQATARELAELLCLEGEAVRVSADFVLSAAAEAELRRRVAEGLAKAGPAGATVAEIKEWLGVSRKHAVPFCEYLDRIGATRREGDRRVAGEPALSPPSPLWRGGPGG